MNLVDITEPTQNNIKENNEQEKQVTAIGIDLGTTNSLVAFVSSNAESYEIIPDDTGAKLTKSIVEVSGHQISSIKRLIGKSGKEINNISNDFPFDEVFSDGNSMAEFSINGKRTNAVEISAEILKDLRKRASSFFKREISKAVITVPAHFDESSRKATKDAAKLAGIEVLRLINEPTAAALAYGLDNSTEGHYVVYDLGGGTFDLSILKMKKGAFKVIATEGNSNLGGDDFDNMLSQKLKINAREANEIKKILSNEEHCDFISRKDFEALIEPKIDETIEMLSELISESGIDLEEIKGIILVGGSTRIPLVKKKLEHFTQQKCEILTNLNPDEIVAAGASISAASLTGIHLNGQHNLLIDVNPLSIGMEIMGGINHKIIERNSVIPISVTKEYTTHVDGQKAINFHLVQGEREMARDCRSLAKFTLTSIPAMKAQMPRVAVNFKIDADGLLTVSATEKTTGIKQEITVKPTYGLNVTKIREMFEDSMLNAEKDVNNKLLSEAKFNSESLISAVRKIMTENGDIVSDSEKLLFNEEIEALECSLKSNDKSKIDEKFDILVKSSEILAARNLDKHAKLMISGKKISELDI